MHGWKETTIVAPIVSSIGSVKIMTAIDCEKKRCPYNNGGICDAEIVSINKRGRCITVLVDKTYFGGVDAE